ncbi:unnamed protein product [Notodromas monacha]|uniref:Uncharacterized protein n=1 Tax=Notodromas monacha TaxID=399045 RepID=A0A7R9BNI4_9CRUS|nr:unnamed protein product [Notodromas monacha]CAG0917400.1 unnamed protein product [Notodromas monacha]
MEDLVCQLKQDFGKIRSKCEDLLATDACIEPPSTVWNRSSCDSTKNRAVKESCVQLEAKIDKLSTFLSNLSERLVQEKNAELCNMTRLLDEKNRAIERLHKELDETRCLRSSPGNESRCCTCAEDPLSNSCIHPGDTQQTARQIETLKTEVREMRRKLSDVKEEKRVLQMNLASLRSSHDALSQEMEGSRDDELCLTTQIADLEAKNETLEAKVECLSKSKRCAEEKMRKLKETQDCQNQELSRYKAKIIAQKSELEDVTHCLQKLQDDINHWQSEAERSKDNYSDLQNRYKELEGELCNTRKDSERLLNDNRELEKRLQTFHEELCTMKKELCSYKNSISELTDENRQLSQQLRENDGNISRNSEVLEDKMTRLQDIVEEKSCKIQHLQQEIQTLRDHNSRLEFELNASTQRLKQAKLKHEDAETRCNRIQATLDTAADAEVQLKQNLEEARCQEQKLILKLSQIEGNHCEKSKLLDRLQKENQRLMKITEKSQLSVSDQLCALKAEINNQSDRYAQHEQQHAIEMQQLHAELEKTTTEKCRLSKELTETKTRLRTMETNASMAQKFRSELSSVQCHVEQVARQKCEAEAHSIKASRKLKALQDQIEALSEEKHKLTSKIVSLETSLDLAQKCTPKESKHTSRENEKILAGLRKSVAEFDCRCRGLVEEVDRSRRQRKMLLKECENRTQELTEAQATITDLKNKLRDSRKTITDLTNKSCAYKRKLDSLTEKLKEHETLFRKMRTRAFGSCHKKPKICRSASDDCLLSGTEHADYDRKCFSLSNECFDSP